MKVSMIQMVAASAMALGLASVASAQVDAFELAWKNGPTRDATFATADYPDSVFVLELYQNSCSACNRNAPNVDELAAEYAGNDKVQVADVGVAQNEREFQNWISRHQPNHPVLAGRRTVVQQLGLQGTPTTVVLDCGLNIVYRNAGVWSAQVKRQLRSVIDSTLATQECGSPSNELPALEEPFTLNIKNGVDGGPTQFSSSDHTDGIFVLEIIQSRCGACIQNAPKVDVLHTAYAQTGRVHVIDVGAFNQTARDYTRWIQTVQPNHLVTDGTQAIFDIVDLEATPTTAIFDCNLNLIYKHIGAWDEATKDAIYALIDDTLANVECAASGIDGDDVIVDPTPVE
jgi:hypothetical protein